MTTRDQAVLMIAGRVQDRCTAAVLELGDAIRRHQIAKASHSPEEELRTREEAKRKGQDVSELARALSEGLGRPL